ncbi:MAG: SDR family NAD(P)-dependent oxidoreductase, partial [Paracoccaceae bacterium]
EEKLTTRSVVIGVNFLPVLHFSHAIAPIMIEQGGGRMLFVTSDAGKVGTSGEAVYAGLKGGVIAFAKSVAREWARYNINVNCTAPGPTDTPLEADQDPDLVARRLKVIPFRRMATPEEQAGAIAFFVSDDADYITGQVLSISGGLTMS